MTLSGTIRTLRDTYGFINGHDGFDYFFIPSGLQMTTLSFQELSVGDDVTFIPIDHPKGPRAIEIRVKESRSNDNKDTRVSPTPISWQRD